jgi:hypothetical protein
MKDDANPMVLAAHVAEIGQSLWLKTTSFFSFRNLDQVRDPGSETPTLSGQR